MEVGIASATTSQIGSAKAKANPRLRLCGEQYTSPHKRTEGQLGPLLVAAADGTPVLSVEPPCRRASLHSVLRNALPIFLPPPPIEKILVTAPMYELLYPGCYRVVAVYTVKVPMDGLIALTLKPQAFCTII